MELCGDLGVEEASLGSALQHQAADRQKGAVQLLSFLKSRTQSPTLKGEIYVQVLRQCQAPQAKA